MTGHPVHRTSTRVADGRQLLCSDDSEPFVSGAATRSMQDYRELPPVATTSSMRWDVLTGEWVALAA